MNDQLASGWPVRNLAHLLALWSFAVFQPTLALIDKPGHADGIMIARTEDGAVWISALIAYAVLPPLVLLGLEALAGLFSPRARSVAHVLFVGILLCVVALAILNELFPAGRIALVLACIPLGVAATLAYVRFDALRQVATVLAPASLVFLAFFLLSSPQRQILFGADTPLVEAEPSDIPVVMIVLDELPISSLMDADGALDRRNYPGFAQLADTSTWYRNTLAAGHETLFAVPSLTSGIQPKVDGVPLALDYPNNIFTLLGNSHDVTAFEHYTHLCPEQICPNRASRLNQLVALESAFPLVSTYALRPDGFGFRLPELGMTPQEISAALDPRSSIDAANAEASERRRFPDLEFEAFLDEIEPWSRGQRPAPFYFIHSGLVHLPWKYLPSGKVYANDFTHPFGLDRAETWIDNQDVVDQGLARHLLSVRFTDSLVRDLISRLRRSGLFDRSLIVLTADQGVSAQAANYRRLAPNEHTAADIGLVPLFVKAPGQRTARTDDALVSALDIVPTIAKMVGSEMPWRVDGQPLPHRSARAEAISSPEPITFTKRQLLDRRRVTLRHQLKAFGTGERSRLFGFGRGRKLLGASVGALDVLDDPSASVELNDADELQSVDHSSRYVPALLTGSIEGGNEGGNGEPVEQLAIAINGRVVAAGPAVDVPARWHVGIPSPDPGGRLFAILVPENSLKDGRNRIEVLAVDRDRRVTRIGEFD